MPSDLVTVVVVAYNNWPDIELAVQSALCQSHRNVEVIVVDNNSDDGAAGSAGLLAAGARAGEAESLRSCA